MTKSRHIRAPRIDWTPDLVRALRDRYPHERTSDIARDLGIPVENVYAKASLMGLKKSAEFMVSPASGRTTGRQGIGTRFTKGLQPWNKGTHFDAGGRSAETRFKKGEMSGAAQHNYAPIGSLRVNADGYLERKVTDDPALFPARRWVGVHRLVWIEDNGPVPDGHVVVFKPGMRSTKPEEITPDKVEMISRVELMKRNTLHNYPKEITQLIYLRGAVQRKINRRLKDDRDPGNNQ